MLDQRVAENSQEYDWKALRRIAKEIPLVKPLFRIESYGMDYLFAPDYSELHNYIAPPLEIIPKQDLDRELRYSLATHALMELTYKKKVLLPPYARELNLHMKYILSYGNNYEAKDLLNAIDYYLNDLALRNELTEVDKADNDSEVIDHIIELAKSHEKKLAHILDLVSRLEEIVARINDLSNNSFIEYANKYININSRDALENSSRFYDELEVIRRKRRGTAHSSLMD